MPAETYLTLLDNAARHSEAIYNQIDNSMTKQLEIQSRQGQFEVETTLKAAQFAEGQRMNDIQAQGIKEENYYRGQQFLAEQELRPLKLQTAQLALQNQKFNYQQAQKQQQAQLFNAISQPFDDSQGFELLRTESVDHAREYNAFKGRVQAYVAGGGEFDAAKYQEGINQINSKYENVDSSKPPEYSEEYQYFLEKISPNLAKTYAKKKDPKVLASKNAVMMSIYGAGASEIKSLGQYRDLYDDEEWAQGMIGRDFIQNNENNITKWNTELERARGNYATAKANGLEEKALTEFKNNMEFYQKNITDALNQNERLYKNTALGRYGPQKELEIITLPPQGQQGQLSPNEVDLSQYPKQGSKLGIDSPKNPDSDSSQQKMHSSVSDLHKAISGINKVDDGKGGKKEIFAEDIYETELADVDLRWYNNNSDGSEPDNQSKRLIKERVENRLDKMNVEERFTRERVEEVLKTLKKDVNVPISSWLKKRLDIIGAFEFSPEEAFITFGPKKKGMTDLRASIKTPEQLFEAVNQMKSEAEKEEAQKELYAALITASFSSGLTTK